MRGQGCSKDATDRVSVPEDVGIKLSIYFTTLVYAQSFDYLPTTRVPGIAEKIKSRPPVGKFYW